MNQHTTCQTSYCTISPKIKKIDSSVLPQEAIDQFRSMWNEKFGPISFEADVTYGLNDSQERLEEVFINVHSVADNFRMLDENKWAYISPAFRHKSIFNTSSTIWTIDPRGLKPLPDDRTGPIDEKAFDELVNEFKQLTGISVRFVLYRALKPIRK